MQNILVKEILSSELRAGIMMTKILRVCWTKTILIE